MECLHEIKLLEYIDAELTSVETAMVRDHLIVCNACNETYQHYLKLESQLNLPLELEPPSIIERSVMEKLFPVLPTYSSVFALIAAGFLLLVTGIYIYFDFANNSIVQALQLTAGNTSNFLGSVISFISTVFSGVYTVFKILDRFINVIFQVNIGAEIIGFTVFVIFSLIGYSVFRFALKKLRSE